VEERVGTLLLQKQLLKIERGHLLVLQLQENIDMSCFGGGDDGEKDQKLKNKAINDQIKKDKDVYKSTHRLLLLGKLNVCEH
jgi:hypothetical protein